MKRLVRRHRRLLVCCGLLLGATGGAVAADGGARQLSTHAPKTPLLMAPGNRLEFLVHAPAPGAKLYLDSEQVIVGCAGDGSAAPVALIPYQMDGSTPNITVHLNGQSQVTEEWTLQNYTNEVHAFHIHQIHFRVMTDVADGRPLMDVINVPAAVQERNGYPGAPGQVTIRLTFTSELAGEFIYHCHILEHEDNGMMGKILVSQD